MAETRCPVCRSHTFESVAVTPINNPNVPLTIVQCASCGTVIAAFERTNVTALISALERDVRVALYALGLKETTKKPRQPDKGGNKVGDD